MTAALALALLALPFGLWLTLSLMSELKQNSLINAGPLRWQNVDGSWSSLQSSAAPYTLLFLGFLSCDSVCPKRLSEMALISRNTDAEQLQVLFITIDATRDTAGIRRQLVDALGIRSGLLEPQALRALRSRLHDRNQELSRHSPRTYLLARDGRVLAIFQGEALSAHAVQKHLSMLNATT
ncbi:SCO family protein [Gilvimarinus sp. SDUM040013]|uniref:SCO family protein n=2 Tax=Gilvimarinus gilvus TaxID=3058038 RepID=A0ABU4RVD2_9GAMM|nr:SCO family protein [Gilvimarinus sp. SDUM040013]